VRPSIWSLLNKPIILVLMYQNQCVLECIDLIDCVIDSIMWGIGLPSLASHLQRSGTLLAPKNAEK